MLMDEQFAIDVMSGRRRGLVAEALRFGCSLASWGYRAAIEVRNRAYDHGWWKTHAVPVPVISLGNITTGGTGKTPLAAYLAERLQQLGYHPGIVSRGYRSLDGQANDERLVLEQLLPTVPQVQNRDRVVGATTAIREHHCDAILLDDGFQHRRLKRDLDLVLIDATRPWGHGRLLPRGLLREPLSSLKRADLILLTRCDQVTTAARQQIRQELARWRGTNECVEIRFVPKQLRNAHGECRSWKKLTPEKSLAFCGIGNPAGFRGLLANLGFEIDPVVFPDHHHYSAADCENLANLVKTTGAQQILTTQKDLVKIPRTELAGRPLWAVEIAAEIVSGQELLEQAMEKIRQSRRIAA